MVGHPTVSELENYLVGRIGLDRVAAVEEHLLVCAVCRTVCTETEIERISFREAAADLARLARHSSPRRRFRLPVPVFGAIAALGIGVAVLTNIQPAPTGVSDVSLVA